jgi:endonuclease-8
MPEGDTLYRVADVMLRTLGDDRIVAARGRPGGAQLERVVGMRVSAVRTRGKHLLIDFDGGLTLHTHLQMFGSWHRYRPSERWRASPEDAVAVLETERAVVVCFSAPTVELIETKALPLHRVLAALGPDLLDPEPDLETVVRRLLAARLTVAVWSPGSATSIAARSCSSSGRIRSRWPTGCEPQTRDASS